jgi:hypothetical protein
MKPVAVARVFLPYVKIVVVLMMQHAHVNLVRTVGAVQRVQPVVQVARVMRIVLRKEKFELSMMKAVMSVNYSVKMDT